MSAVELVTDEKIVEDVLHFLRVGRHVAAPPAFKSEVAGAFRVHFRVESVLLRYQRVGWIEAFEVLDQPGAVEDAVAPIAGEGSEPAAA